MTMCGVALRGRACASGRVLSCMCVRARACVVARLVVRARVVCVCVCSRVVARACSRAVCSRVGGRPHTHARPTHNSRRNKAILCPASDRRGPPRPQLRPHTVLRARGAARAAARDWRRHRGLKKTLSSSSSAIVCATSDHARTTSHARKRTTTHTRPRFLQQGSPGRPRLPQTGCREHIGHLVTIIGLPMTASIGTGRFRRSAPSSPEHET